MKTVQKGGLWRLTKFLNLILNLIYIFISSYFVYYDILYIQYCIMRREQCPRLVVLKTVLGQLEQSNRQFFFVLSNSIG